ncbi:putative retinal pigment epithelial membrane protein [Trypoxylus dichotomus]
MSANSGKGCIFDWSPLPQRKYLTRKHGNASSEGGDDKILYPSCDNLLWLRSCDKEVIEPLKGKMMGKIPEWLNGTLIRNGPGSFKVGNYTYEHLFDSAALLHRFRIHEGKVSYQCRFLQSDVYKRNMTAKRIIFTEFGTKAIPDPCQTIFSRIASIFTTKKNMSDNAMITVYPFGDELYAFPETPVVHKVNKDTLATEGKVYVNDYVAIVNHTSHPHIMNDGTVYNLAMSIGLTGPIHHIICFPNSKTNDGTKETSFFEKAHFVAGIPARWRFHPSYMHTFGITENYFVIVEQPLSISIADLAKCKYYNDPLIGAFTWFHKEKAKINILSRQTGKPLHSFLTDSFFYLHIINQYEIDDYVVVDICCYRDPTMLECMYVEALKNLHKNPDYAKMFRGRPLRFVLPLKTKNANIGENLISFADSNAKAYLKKNGMVFVVPEKLCNLGCETPRINYERSLGKFYQFFYAISADVDADNPGTLIKVDVINKHTKTWCEENCYPSEPVFVAKPNSQSEDDGILLSALLWGNNETNRVGLLIIDARTMMEIGRVEFKTPGAIPKCLHGWFIPE